MRSNEERVQRRVRDRLDRCVGRIARRIGHAAGRVRAVEGRRQGAVGRDVSELDPGNIGRSVRRGNRGRLVADRELVLAAEAVDDVEARRGAGRAGDGRRNELRCQC